ncbi:hypothetical protein GE061_003997, partial [Apolygus lucorum]
MMSARMLRSNSTLSAVAAAVNVPPASPAMGSKGVFSIINAAPSDHKFKHLFYQCGDSAFNVRVKEEIKLLQSSLPPGIWVTTFEDRM